MANKNNGIIFYDMNDVLLTSDGVKFDGIFEAFYNSYYNKKPLVISGIRTASNVRFNPVIPHITKNSNSLTSAYKFIVYDTDENAYVIEIARDDTVNLAT